ncbi:glycosyltransferase [Flavobacterium sp.]|uniref:glycosyltransferase family 2 protein n=1 Tax=Flavobacterium sp. TaxID=239 RepID=UPI00379CAE3E
MISIILFSVIFIYAITIACLIYGFSKVNSFEYIGLAPKTKFTIIVPFRDETENLPQLLTSFSKLNYPNDLFEVILVDDFSKEEFKVQNLPFKVSITQNNRVSNSPKKDAILTAMQLVKTDWIITTDADCLVHKNWLLTLDNYIRNQNISMIASAVTYDCSNSFLHHFQQLDLASLQGATMGSFGLKKGFMCNGANFAYTKSLFEKLKGFQGNDGIASGDDVFLLQKAIAQFPEKVHYLKSKNNIVHTKPLNDWKSLFYQRVRWASKTGWYQSKFGIGLGLVVFAGNFCWVLGLGSWVLGFISFLNLILLVLIKCVVDAVLIQKSNHFLTKKKMRYLVLSSLLYPFFSVSVALYSLFGKYEWKGREF